MNKWKKKGINAWRTFKNEFVQTKNMLNQQKERTTNAKKNENKLNKLMNE